MHKAVEHPQQYRHGQDCDVLGVPEARPVGQQEDTDQADEPATPDRDPDRIQNDIRVGQGAWRNPLLYGFSAALQQSRAPGPESSARMILDITDRMPPSNRAVSRRLRLTTYINCSCDTRARCTNRNRQSGDS